MPEVGLLYKLPDLAKWVVLNTGLRLLYFLYSLALVREVFFTPLQFFIKIFISSYDTIKHLICAKN